MKRTNMWMLATILSCGLLTVSCTDNHDNPVADGPVTNQNIVEESDFSDYIDLNTFAGDDFFRYATGKWMASHPLQKGQERNGCLAEQAELADQFLSDVSKGLYGDAIVSRLVSGFSPASFEADKALLKQKVATIQAADSKEALYQVMAQLIEEGYQAPFYFASVPFQRKVTPALLFPFKATDYWAEESTLTTYADIPADDAKRIFKAIVDWIGVLVRKELITRNTLAYHHDPLERLAPIGQSRTRAGGTSMLQVIADKLGIDGQVLLADENYAWMQKELESYSLEKLKDLLVYLVVDRDFRFMPTPAKAGGKQYTAGDIVYNLLNIAYSPLSTRIGYIYIDQKVNPESKPVVLKMAEEVRQAFRQRIAGRTWLSPATKEKATEKVDAMILCIGWPDKRDKAWEMSEKPLDASASTYQNVLNLFRERTNIFKKGIGKTSTDDLFAANCFVCPAYTANAFYDYDNNMMFILPTNMVPPIYDSSRSLAYNYGQLSAGTIGHEITHGFDSNGCQYDKNGIKTDWWTPADKNTFLDLQEKMINRYQGVEFWPGYYIDGKRTLAENIADLGGLYIGYDAFVNKLRQMGVSGQELDRQGREYFRGFAYGWSEVFNEGWAKDAYATDVHSPNFMRTNGTVYMMDEFYRLFRITSGKEYVAPQYRIEIW